MSQTRRTAADEPFLIVRSLSAQAVAGEETGRHVHPWGQIIYCSAGVMTVWTEAGSWVAPPHWAVWVPAGVSHQIRFAGPAALRTLYLRGDVAARLPSGCAVLTVSPLLRELILRVLAEGMLDGRSATHRAIARLILDEAARRDAPAFDLPTPQTAPARRAAQLLAKDDGRLTTHALAEQVGLGARTLERRFLMETGLTVAAWGRQARMLHSLRLLAAGQPVKSAAQAAGFRTASAFVAAFRRAFGKTPARYFAGAL